MNYATALVRTAANLRNPPHPNPDQALRQAIWENPNAEIAGPDAYLYHQAAAAIEAQTGHQGAGLHTIPPQTALNAIHQLIGLDDN